jgi:hypothetical protein
MPVAVVVGATVGATGPAILAVGCTVGETAGGDVGTGVSGPAGDDAVPDAAPPAGEVVTGDVANTDFVARTDLVADGDGLADGLATGAGVWFFVLSMTPAIATPPQHRTSRTVVTTRTICSVFGLRRSTSSGFGLPVGETAG